ncbi:hypothetical protein [Palleronia pelagia]|uniref:Uncharacterized protein n=1 Tax=Palleronia pelagia TaxID=387096 RepID=A0A1H8D0H9_9RHOB|nr:hypothetical protein [Palleronia pelagia]SEN00941.1 hypothetical protein SAMN04488011_102157 [Palleronia pelagia]
MTTILKTGFTAAILTAFAISLAPDAAPAAPHLSLPGIDLPAGGDAQIVKIRRGRGADDGPGHDMNDDKGGRKGGKGRGADDAPGDDKGGKGRGRDDGPNHT